MHVAQDSDYDNSTKSWMLMITDWRHQLLSVDRVVGMTWTKLLGSWAELLSGSIYICLIAQTQSAVQHKRGIIIQAPDGEFFCLRTKGLYCGREEGWPTLLTFFQSCTCEAGWWPKFLADNGRKGHWQRARRQTQRPTRVRPKWNDQIHNVCRCKSSFKCNRMGWSLHLAFWLPAWEWMFNWKQWDYEEKIYWDRRTLKGKLFLSCLNSELYHERNWSYTGWWGWNGQPLNRQSIHLIFSA